MLPQEIIQDFIGKKCIITILSRNKIKGTITKVDGMWFEIEDDNSKTMINGAIVREIKTFEK